MERMSPRCGSKHGARGYSLGPLVAPAPAVTTPLAWLADWCDPDVEHLTVYLYADSHAQGLGVAEAGGRMVRDPAWRPAASA